VGKNLIDNRHVVRCWNRTPKDLPNFHGSSLEAAEGAEAIFVVVADPRQCSLCWIISNRNSGRVS
jgi:3-hydroxyisobutyrate dehydrogenase-like beta-hydroxyacid dehydrogenase